MALPLNGSSVALCEGATRTVTKEVAGLSGVRRSAVWPEAGGLAIVLAGERPRNLSRGGLLGPRYEMRGVAIRADEDGDVEVALRSCASRRGGCAPETCGAAVLSVTNGGVVMEGDGALATPASVTGFFSSLRDGIDSGRLHSVGASRSGFRAASEV